MYKNALKYQFRLGRLTQHFQCDAAKLTYLYTLETNSKQLVVGNTLIKVALIYQRYCK